MNPLAVKLGPMMLEHPILNGSGTMEIFDVAEALGPRVLEQPPMAAYVAKTVTLEPRAGNAPPRIVETPAGMINAIGLSNEGADAFIATRLPRLLDLPCPVILSVGGFSASEYTEVVQRLLDAVTRLETGTPLGDPPAPAGMSATVPGTATGSGGAADAAPRRGDWTCRVGLELNVSCPNVHSGCISIGTDVFETEAVVRAVRRIWPGLLIVKLTPNVTDIPGIARAAEGAGASALALVNTYRGLALDRVSLRPYLGNITGGVSGPAIRPLALAAVYEVFASVSIPLIGMGGIATLQDALEFMACGAAAVATGSAGFSDPFLAAHLAERLPAALADRGLTLPELVGIAHRE